MRYLLDEKHVVFLDVWVCIVWEKESDIIHLYKHKLIYSIMLSIAFVFGHSPFPGLQPFLPQPLGPGAPPAPGFSTSLRLLK